MDTELNLKILAFLIIFEVKRTQTAHKNEKHLFQHVSIEKVLQLSTAGLDYKR